MKRQRKETSNLLVRVEPRCLPTVARSSCIIRRRKTGKEKGGNNVYANPAAQRDTVVEIETRISSMGKESNRFFCTVVPLLVHPADYANIRGVGLSARNIHARRNGDTRARRSI